MLGDTAVAAQEIERKYLVPLNDLSPLVKGSPAFEIRQGYLALDPNGTEVRIRSKGEKYFLTVKSAGELQRTEVEFEVTREQFAALWSTTAGRRVEKTRYELKHDNHVIEVDAYEGQLAGLVTAEIEFSSVAESQDFTVPSWLGLEVTDDARYKNKNLAVNGRPN